MQNPFRYFNGIFKRITPANAGAKSVAISTSLGRRN
jgi:hypothetical protein